MLPTPSTSHIPGNVYEPAEDSFLVLDTLSSPAECAFLSDRFRHRTPLVVEIGPGSGVILAFVTANASSIFGSKENEPSILTMGIDVNYFACPATYATVRTHCLEEKDNGTGVFLDVVMGDLTAPLRPHQIDVLIFNPPYVPSEKVPETTDWNTPPREDVFERDSNLLALATDGGEDGMEVTNRLLDQLALNLNAKLGVAYVLLCRRNNPERVIRHLESDLGNGWDIRIVRTTGKQAGWERLSILRISRRILNQ